MTRKPTILRSLETFHSSFRLSTIFWVLFLILIFFLLKVLIEFKEMKTILMKKCLFSISLRSAGIILGVLEIIASFYVFARIILNDHNNKTIDSPSSWDDFDFFGLKNNIAFQCSVAAIQLLLSTLWLAGIIQVSTYYKFFFRFNCTKSIVPTSKFD